MWVQVCWGVRVDRLVVDMLPDGRVSVSVQWSGASVAEQVAEPTAWFNPLTEQELEDLRWYLEDYLGAPFEVYEQRGARVAQAIRSWGEALFASLFAGGTGTGTSTSTSKVRDAYVALRSRPGGAEVTLRSTDERVLGLPWELLRDPAAPEAMALGGVAVTRMLPGQIPAHAAA